jgi:hypothetical protein
MQGPEFDWVADAADDAKSRVRVLLHHITGLHLLVRKHLFPTMVWSRVKE